MRRLAAPAAAALLCAACGSTGGAGPGAVRAPGAAPAVCSAQAASRAVARPAGFPADFPLPAGTLLTSAQDRGSAGVVVTGVTARPFRQVLAALQHDLPARGYTASEGESEPHDAESDWASAGWTGRWAIRALPACPGDTAVSVVARAR